MQRQSAKIRQASRTYRLAVWWGTSVEATSGFHRLKREGKLTDAEVSQAIDRLNQLRARWDEIEPSESVREMAERLLTRHKLRRQTRCNWRRRWSGAGTIREGECLWGAMATC